MDVNDRISMYYQEYKADMSAARIAEQKGNIEGARKGDLAKLVEIARQLTDGFDRLDRSCLK